MANHDDPFVGGKSEVLKTIDAANSLYQRWRELVNSSQTSQEDCEWTANELRNCLRSIDWDLEDLEETILIIENNPKTFKVDCKELHDRRQFVELTRASVKEMREHLTAVKTKSKHGYGANMDQISSGSGPDQPLDKYTRLVNESDGVEERLITGQLLIAPSPDDLADVLHMSVPECRIASELGEQSVHMLNNNVQINANTDASICRRLMKILHMYKSWKLWVTFSALIVVIIVIIICFIFF